MISSGIYSLRSIRLPQRPIFPSLCNGRKTLVTSSTSVSVNQKKEKVIVISGPTGAGKTRLALELAKRLNGEIISADSVQVYRGLDVGSAKPSPADRQVPNCSRLLHILHFFFTKISIFWLIKLSMFVMFFEALCIYIKGRGLSRDGIHEWCQLKIRIQVFFHSTRGSINMFFEAFAVFYIVVL